MQPASKDSSAGTGHASTRDRKRRPGTAHGNPAANAPAGPSYSSSRPRPNWRDWRSRPRPTPRRRAHDSASGKGGPQGCRCRQAKTSRSQADQGRLSEGDRAGARAVEQMERTVKSLKQKDAQAAYPPAEEARKILEEIQKAQPKQDQQDQKQQDQTRRTRTSRRKIRRINRRKTSRRKIRKTTEEGPAEERPGKAEEAGSARRSRDEPKQVTTRSETASSRRSRAIGSKRHCGGSANVSRKSANATA